MELPQTVRHALGPEAAKDFVAWLSEQLFSSGTKEQVRISAFVARQKVNVLVFEQVSNLFLADEPTLSQKEDGNWVWRVPVDFTLPSQGRVGRVGELEVDARYGQVYYSQAKLSQMADEAERLLQQVEEKKR